MLNADTGKLLWEHRFNIYLSDVPPHRVGWASPVGDPATGNVYAFGVGGTLLALSREGKVVWERSLGEDFGLLTTHGGRTVSPLIDGDLVIISGVTFQWGQHRSGAHRFMAFDKKTGETIWVSAPGGRPYDTTYAAPIIVNINGTRLLIQGASDGVVHAMKPQTGEPVWKYEISKRGLNTGTVVHGTTAILTHSEENLDSSEMGMMVAVDATAKGEIKKEQVKWRTYGWQGGFSSPVLDGDRLYQLDNSANLGAFDVNTGKQLWLKSLGTVQKGSPVLADGKLYVGTETGKFYILKPGEKVNFRVRLFDETGTFIREEPSATWALDQLKGTVTNGEFVAASDAIAQAGLVKATVGSITGSASVRVFPPLPWSEDFEAMALNSVPATWVNTTPKFAVRELNGNKVLVKTKEGSSLASRARAYIGPSDWSNYTVEVDINGTQKRRQQGDGGVLAQRYALVLYGNSQMLHLEPWQPETKRTVTIPFAWKPDTWYRMKLQVENLPDGKVRARGKVWLASETEPTAWMIERIDPIPNRQGAPGLFGSALAELYFDNLKVYANK